MRGLRAIGRVGISRLRLFVLALQPKEYVQRLDIDMRGLWRRWMGHRELGGDVQFRLGDHYRRRKNASSLGAPGCGG